MTLCRCRRGYIVNANVCHYCEHEGRSTIKRLAADIASDYAEIMGADFARVIYAELLRLGPEGPKDHAYGNQHRGLIKRDWETLGDE